MLRPSRKEVHCHLDISQLQYLLRIVHCLFLGMYDIILDTLEEVVLHNVNYKMNKMWLSGDDGGSQFKYTIDELQKEEGIEQG